MSKSDDDIREENKGKFFNEILKVFFLCLFLILRQLKYLLSQSIKKIIQKKLTKITTIESTFFLKKSLK